MNRTQSKSDWQLQRLSKALGVEWVGYELRPPFNEATVNRLRTELCDHQLVVLRNQNLDPATLAELANCLGTVGTYPFVEGMDNQPDVIEIRKEPDQTSHFGGLWHTDTSYLPTPPEATLLYAVQVPNQGGDTLFANQYLAFQSVSPAMREWLCQLQCVNSAALSAAQVRGNHLAAGTMRRSDHVVPERLSAIHPLVQTHPRSGAQCWYFSPAHTECLHPLTEAKSKPIINYLAGVATRPEYSFRLQWQPGTLVLWDNRSLLHCAINDYDGDLRVMWRVTLQQVWFAESN